MEKQNLYQVLNEFNSIFGENPISIKPNFVANGFIYLKMLYDKHVDIPANGEEHSWNQFGNSGENYAMVKLCVKRDMETNLPKFLLFKDSGIYVNPHTMPDENKAQRLYKAVAMLSGDDWEERFFGTYDIVISDKILKASIELAEKAILQEKRTIANTNNLTDLNAAVRHLSDTINVLQILKEEYRLRRGESNGNN